MLKNLILLSFLILANCSYRGIDVSVWQGDNIDFNKVKAAGINFVIIRAGCGYNKDKNFESNYRKAKAAGLNVGAYWYALALTESQSKQEANYALNAISGKQLEYPIYYDIEQNEILRKGKAFCSSIAVDFCTIMENNKKFCGIYASKNFFDNYFTDYVKNRYSIWVAQYYSQCTYKGQYGIWQYSCEGRVNGISGDVDLDTSYQNFPEIIKKAHLNGF